MKVEQELVAFLRKARDDIRIGPIHVSVFAAILYLQAKQRGANPVKISARKLMPVARIWGSGPYHRTIRQLHAFGYLDYTPSCNPRVPSRVRIKQR